VTYKGKVDWWIGLWMIGGIGGPGLSAIALHLWPLLAVPLIVTAFILIAVFPQAYDSMSDALRIRHGPITRAIPWPSIISVSPSSDSRSSFALSLDRVSIEYVSGAIIIAPEDQVHFFDDVAAHCPQLSRRGMELIITMNQ